ADAAGLGGDTEVQADGLDMAHVQVAVGLRGKARHDPPMTARREVIGDDLADEVAPAGIRSVGHGSPVPWSKPAILPSRRPWPGMRSGTRQLADPGLTCCMFATL